MSFILLLLLSPLIEIGVPHASFDNPLTVDSDIRRESIEFRTLVRW